MSKFDFSEIIKITYKVKSEKRKDKEYYECFKEWYNLDQQVSVEEPRDDNTAKDDKAANDDSSNLKDLLSNLTSIIAMIAGFYAGFSRFTDALYSENAGRFYNVSSDLFYPNRNFRFIIMLAIYILTILVLLSPIILRDKQRNKKIDRFESFLFSLLMSSYVGFIFFVILIYLLIKFNYKIDIIYIYIVSFIFWIFLWRLYYYIITDIPNFLIKSREDIKLNLGIINEVGDANLPKGKFRLYIFYTIFIVVIILCTASWAMREINLDPKDKMSYEILKDEKAYNVIIGYKNDMAITLTGVESVKSGDRRLKFINNEYKIQEVKNKVVVYKRFDKVIPYKNYGLISGSNGSESKTVD